MLLGGLLGIGLLGCVFWLLNILLGWLLPNGLGLALLPRLVICCTIEHHALLYNSLIYFIYSQHPYTHLLINIYPCS